jgi:ParB/RepB/Spo0J family partition protein
MIVMQPAKNVHINSIDVDTKHRLLEVKPARIAKLAESLTQVGRILTPICVTSKMGRFQVVAGATRLAAAKHLGWEVVPAVVISGTDDEIKQVEIEENLGRHDLTEKEREHLEHARKICRANIDAAVEEAKAHAAAQKEKDEALKAEQQKAAAAHYRRCTEEQRPGALKAAAVTANAIFDSGKRKHRKTGGKRGRPSGGAAAIARKHGAKPDTVRARVRREAISATSRKKPTEAATANELHHELKNFVQKFAAAFAAWVKTEPTEDGLDAMRNALHSAAEKLSSMASDITSLPSTNRSGSVETETRH